MEHPFFQPDGQGSDADRLLQALRMDLDACEFDDLALALLRQQAATVPPYSRLLRALGIDPTRCTHWTDFPALPASAFRDGPVCGFDPASAVAVFETSGTTSGLTGRHYFASTVFYEKALRTAFEAFMPDLTEHTWVLLVPPPALRPHSSLAFMLGCLAPRDAAWCCDAQYRIDTVRLRAVLGQSVRPVALFGTSFALADAAESCPCPLPPGSVIFDTGGMKGRRRQLERHTFLDLLGSAFNLHASRIWNEYGMTEWSSQGYARMDDGLHRFPPWLRIRVIDPTTGIECPPGTPGIVQACDLANVGSVAAIATRDAAQWESSPHGPGLRLLGRWDDATPRGCSLPYE
jgi:hypothetical protein